MAKLPDKFEDWTPPWDEDDFDADKAAKLVFNARKATEKAKERSETLESENGELQTKLTAAESKGSGKDDSEKDKVIASLTKERDDLQKNGRPEDKSLVERLEVAIEHGLTAADARRLVGKDRDELSEDAADLAKRFGIERGNDEEGQEPASQEPPQRGVKPRDQVGNGRERAKPVDKVFSAAELLTQTGQTEAGLHLAPLGR